MDKHTYYVGAKPAIERLVKQFEEHRRRERIFMSTPWGRAWATCAKSVRPAPIRSCPRVGAISVSGVDMKLDVFVTSSRRSGEV